MKFKKKILIIGGTGFLGYHLAKESLKKNFLVTSISTKRAKKNRFLKKVKYVFCDIQNKKKLEKKINTYYDYVVNFGGNVDHSRNKDVLKTHFYGCKNLSDIFLKNPPKLFIQIGSSAEYGKKKSPHSEKIKCRPLSIYGKSKLLSTKYLIRLYEKNKFPVTILRLYQVFGPHQETNRLISFVIDSCLKNKKFPCSDGKQFRDFLHVDHVIRAIFKSIKSTQSKGKVINIGAGKTWNVKKVILYINSLIGRGIPEFGKIKLRKEESLKIYPKINNAKKIINWYPSDDFLKKLRHTVKSFNAK